MYRISSQLSNNDSQFYLRRREYQLNKVQNQLSSNEKIRDLRDDPSAAATGSRLDSFLHRQEQFKMNAEHSIDTHRYIEGKIREAVDIFQRIRELSVKAANGTFDGSDRNIIAVEVDELLKELVNVTNSKNGDGKYIFAGTNFETQPLQIEYGNVNGQQNQYITQIDYQGNNDTRNIEISENEFVTLDVAANRVFWGQNHQITSLTDATGYIVNSDAIINIDGHTIELSAGDGLGAIVYKINQSVPGVRASIDSVRNSLVLTTTTPHQITLSDAGGVLQDLGIYNQNNFPSFIEDTAEQFGDNVFNNIVALRNALFANDSEYVGSVGLQSMDASIDSALNHLASVGALQTRADIVANRLSDEIVNLTSQTTKLLSPDLTESIIRLKEEEASHRAALAVAARIIPQTLLDFIR